jgi:hypothetical protein
VTRTPAAHLARIAVLAAVAGWIWTGHYFYKGPIGLDPSGFWLGETLQRIAVRVRPEIENTVVWIAMIPVSLLAIGAVAFVWMRRVVRARRAEIDPARRTFLTGAGAGAGAALAAVASGAAGAAARGVLGFGEGKKGWLPTGTQIQAKATYTDPNPRPEWQGSRIASYRRFGRTEWQVSDIVLGTGRITAADGEAIARAAIERGVNYFDTSPDYAGAGSEQVMGRAIRGVRDRLFIATKFCTPTGHLPAGTPVAVYKQAIEGSLSRLGTDYVDLVHVHSCDEVERLIDPNVHEAFDRLKQEGKVRFLGFSTHTPNLVRVAEQAIASGRFDVMMLAYHHGIWPQLADLIRRARSERDMGVVAMKTLKGAKHRGLEDFAAYADSYSQAALKWVLSNHDVSCAVISFFERQHVDEFLYASGKPFGAGDQAVLDAYDRRIAGSYCAPHCGACHDSCPEGLPIADVLRYRMYLEDYGHANEGVAQYAKLAKNASACLDCSAPCAGSCPLGIAIRDRMLGAHQLLS